MAKSPTRFYHAFLLLVLSGASAASAATRGALETFSSQNNANSWGVVDTLDPENAYFPFWNSNPSSGDPDIYFYFTDDAPFYFFADAVSSTGYFTGDYTSENILAVGCNFFIEDFASFDGADIFFYSDSDKRFYYSRYFDTATYFVGSGWDSIETGLLGAPWFIFQSGSYLATTLTADSLRSVSQIGVRCFALNASADATVVALDNFYLVPELTAPSLLLDSDQRGSLSGEFNMNSGQSYNLWTSNHLLDWIRLGDYRDLTGPGTTLFDVPVPPGIDTYLDLSTEESYTEVPDINP
jgi:hypothetical protein